MTTQTTMFPKTELDEATAVLAHLISEEEKADKAADAAGQKAADTASRVRKQRHVVAKLQDMMPAAEPIVDGETAPEDIEEAEILQIEGDVLDPITGEVTSKADAVSCDTCGRDCNMRQRKGSGHTGCGDGSWEPRKADEIPCPACDGDGRIPDKTGGGHHGRCEMCGGSGVIAAMPPEVWVAWPDNLDMQRIEVGPLTRYGELAAKFLNSLPGDDPRREDSFLDYRIVDVDADAERDPHAIITPADYGLEFSVESIVKAEESAA